MRKQTTMKLQKWLLPVVFFVILAGLLAGGYYFYIHQAEQIKNEKFSELDAISSLKLEQLERWRLERLGDARVISSDTYFVEMSAGWLAGDRNEETRAYLLERVRVLKDNYEYLDVIITDLNGNIQLNLNPGLHALDPVSTKLINASLAENDALMGDFFICSVCGDIHLDLAAPLVDARGRAVGAVVLRINPHVYLYPLIQSWPTPSPSAETLLVRRDGESVLYLNDLRFTPDAALKMTIPLTRTDLPAVQAVIGVEERFEGFDYRGVPVLAYLHPVPGTGWYMVAKVDRSEILTEVRTLGWTVGGFVLAFGLLAGLLTAYLFNLRQRNIAMQLLNVRQEHFKAQEEFRTTLYSIGDAVITTDTSGRVRNLNPVAEALTGWTETDARGQPLEAVLQIVNEETRQAVESPAVRVLREGLVVGLANHTLLISRDGTEHPVADSGAPIRDEKGEITGVVLVFRDQAQERYARRALEESEERFRLLFNHMYEGVALHELVLDESGKPVNYRLVACNEQYVAHTGIELDNVLGRLATEAYGTSEPPYLEEFSRTALTRIPAHLEVFFAPLGKHFDISIAPWGANGFATIFTDITIRKEQEIRLNGQLEELRRWYEATLGREERILELKHEVNEALAKTSQPPRYPEVDGGQP